MAVYLESIPARRSRRRSTLARGAAVLAIVALAATSLLSFVTLHQTALPEHSFIVAAAALSPAPAAAR